VNARTNACLGQVLLGVLERDMKALDCLRPIGRIVISARSFQTHRLKFPGRKPAPAWTIGMDSFEAASEPPNAICERSIRQNEGFLAVRELVRSRR
jgi:hypothetical protein